MNTKRNALAAALTCLALPLAAGITDHFSAVQHQLAVQPLPLEVARLNNDKPHVYHLIGQGFGTQGQPVKVFLKGLEVPPERLQRLNPCHLVLTLAAPLTDTYQIQVTRAGAEGLAMMFDKPAAYDSPLQMVLSRSSKYLVRVEVGRFEAPSPGARKVYLGSQETLITPHTFNECLTEAFGLDPAKVASYAAESPDAPFAGVGSAGSKASH